MAADDDADCAGHEWVLQELRLTLNGAEMASECRWCGAVSYEPSQSGWENR